MNTEKQLRNALQDLYFTTCLIRLAIKQHRPAVMQLSDFDKNMKAMIAAENILKQTKHLQ